MAEYQLLYESETVLRTLDQAYIPNDPANRDRQGYEQWLADGGVPDPAVEPPRPERQPTKLDANPVDPMDAATKISVEQYVTGIVEPMKRRLNEMENRLAALERR